MLRQQPNTRQILQQLYIFHHDVTEIYILKATEETLTFAFWTWAVVASLEGAVKVEADAVACDAWVLISEREDEGWVVAQADAALSHTQAPLRLAEKHHIWGQREVRVVL